MTPQRLRTKLRKIRVQAEELMEEGGELNFIPYLDIVTNVVMFMLATATFAGTLGDINVSSPTPSTGLQTTEPEKPKAELNLTVNIVDNGFIIAASGAVLHKGFRFVSGQLVQVGTELPSIPKRNGLYDFAGLTEKMLEIKHAQAADETKVILNANPNILYETVIGTLDACRGQEKTVSAGENKERKVYEGFNDVVLAAGIN